MPQLTFRYPDVDTKRVRIVEYNAPRFGDVPAIQRPDFTRLIAKARGAGGIIVGPEIETFGCTMQDFRDACAMAHDAGVRLFVRAELQGGRVREMLSSSAFVDLLAALPQDARLTFRPVSQVRGDYIPPSSHITTEMPGSYHVYVMEDAPADVVAHELVHVVLDAEGYPVLTGGRDASVFDGALSDVEVERRLALFGFDNSMRLNNRVRELAKSPPQHQDFSWLVTSYVTFSLYDLRDTVSRDRFRNLVRAVRPAAADVGEEIIRLTEDGSALREPQRATRAFLAVADYLKRTGVGDYVVKRADGKALL